MHVISINRILLACFFTLLFCLISNPAASQPTSLADGEPTERLLAGSSTGDPIHHASLVVSAGSLNHIATAGLRRLTLKALPCLHAQVALHPSISALGPRFLPPSLSPRPPSRSVNTPLLI